jgi:hypothetical protein
MSELSGSQFSLLPIKRTRIRYFKPPHFMAIRPKSSVVAVCRNLANKKDLAYSTNRLYLLLFLEDKMVPENFAFARVEPFPLISGGFCVIK